MHGNQNPPSTLTTLSTSILHAFPRYNGGSNTFPYYNSSNESQFTKEAESYAWGLLIAILIPLIFALICIIASFILCIGRCTCNSCGGKYATKLYSKNERMYLRYGIFGLFIFIIVL